MKTKFFRIISAVVVAVMCLTVLASCDLVVTETDKDMNQVVVEVEIDGIKTQIKKREILSAYMSYGYNYVQQYNYTVEDTFKLILDNLITNDIVIIKAKQVLIANCGKFKTNVENNTATDFEKEFYEKVLKKSGEYVALTNASDATDFLSAFDVAKATYELKRSLNSLVDSNEATEEEEHQHEDETLTVRTVPTKASEEEEEKVEADYTAEELKNKIDFYNAYSVIPTISTRKNAVKNTVKMLADNGLIDSDEYEKLELGEDKDAKYNLENYSYYKEALLSSYESLIVGKYEKYLEAQATEKLNNDALWSEFDALQESQKKKYDADIKAYETALDGVSDTSFVVYNPLAGYMYVENLLIPFSTQQAEELKEKTPATVTDATRLTYENDRKALAANIIAKDLRETWVLSGYGKYDGSKYTFDEKYFVSENSALREFKGELIEPYYILEEETDEETGEEKEIKVDKAQYVKTNSVAFADFMTKFAGYMSATDTSWGLASGYQYSGKATAANWKEIFEDLMFAYSSDTGCLNKEFGYVHTPIKTNTSFVEEFYDGCAALQATGDYVVALTDFGYHIIICTKIVEQGKEYDTKEEFVLALNDDNSIASKFKKAKSDANISNTVSKIANSLLTVYNNDEYVTRYEAAYSNLWSTTSESAE